MCIVYANFDSDNWKSTVVNCVILRARKCLCLENPLNGIKRFVFNEQHRSRNNRQGLCNLFSYSILYSIISQSITSCLSLCVCVCCYYAYVWYGIGSVAIASGSELHIIANKTNSVFIQLCEPYDSLSASVAPQNWNTHFVKINIRQYHPPAAGTACQAVPTHWASDAIYLSFYAAASTAASTAAAVGNQNSLFAYLLLLFCQWRWTECVLADIREGYFANKITTIQQLHVIITFICFLGWRAHSRQFVSILFDLLCPNWQENKTIFCAKLLYTNIASRRTWVGRPVVFLLLLLLRRADDKRKSPNCENKLD